MQPNTTKEKPRQLTAAQAFPWKAKKDRRGWWLLGIYIYISFGGGALMILFSWADPEVMIPLVFMFIPSSTMLLMIRKGLLKKPFWGRYIARIFFFLMAISFVIPIVIIILLYIPAYYSYYMK